MSITYIPRVIAVCSAKSQQWLYVVLQMAHQKCFSNKKIAIIFFKLIFHNFRITIKNIQRINEYKKLTSQVVKTEQISLRAWKFVPFDM